MNTEHTPGPWNPAGPISTHIIDSKGIMVADVPHFREMTRKEGFANRDLIAAAPDLLAALKAMLFAFEELAKVIKPLSSDPVVVASRAAVAKAEGKA